MPKTYLAEVPAAAEHCWDVTGFTEAGKSGDLEPTKMKHFCSQQMCWGAAAVGKSGNLLELISSIRELCAELMK